MAGTGFATFRLAARGRRSRRKNPANSGLFLRSSALFSASLRLCVEWTSPSCDFQEVADDFQAYGAGLFGVELDSVHVAAFERGGVAEFVGASGAGTLVFGHVVAVREVHVGAGVQIVNELRCRAHFELVPAHVGNARNVWKAPHGTGVDAEAADFRGLFAGIEQRLHAEADAEKGHAGLNALDEGFAYPQGVERAH